MEKGLLIQWMDRGKVSMVLKLQYANNHNQKVLVSLKQRQIFPNVEDCAPAQPVTYVYMVTNLIRLVMVTTATTSRLVHKASKH